MTKSPSILDHIPESHTGNYDDVISADESVLKSWYYFVKTKAPNNGYIYRSFFPETKQITREVSYKDESFKVRHGLAKYWHENGKLKSIGQYVDSQKTGIWKSYDRKTGALRSQGEYIFGKRYGVWSFNDKEGRLKEEINYEFGLKEGEFAEYDSLSNVINTGIYRSDTIFNQSKITIPESTSDEQMPCWAKCKSKKNLEQRKECSEKALLKYIYNKLTYPTNARKYGLQGMTVTQFKIGKDGRTKDIDVIIGLCQEFVDMNTSIILNMPSWEPGMKNGEKVDVLYTLPIRYKIN